jgi:hypothetical protein
MTSNEPSKVCVLLRSAWDPYFTAGMSAEPHSPAHANHNSQGKITWTTLTDAAKMKKIE